MYIIYFPRMFSHWFAANGPQRAHHPLRTCPIDIEKPNGIQSFTSTSPAVEKSGSLLFCKILSVRSHHGRPIRRFTSHYSNRPHQHLDLIRFPPRQGPFVRPVPTRRVECVSSAPSDATPWRYRHRPSRRSYKNSKSSIEIQKSRDRSNAMRKWALSSALLLLLLLSTVPDQGSPSIRRFVLPI